MPSDLESFLYRADRLPGRLKVWQHGPTALPALLRGHTYAAMRSLHWLESNAPNRVLDDPGAQLLISERMLQISDVAARLYSWAARWSEDRRIVELSWDHPDVRKALERSEGLAHLQTLAFAARGGRYLVTKHGSDRFELRINRRFVENACHGQQLIFDAYQAEPANFALADDLMNYIRRSARMSPQAALGSIPEDLALKVLRHERARCTAKLIPANTDIGGLTLGHALELYARFLVIAAFAERLASVRQVPEAAILTPTREALIEKLTTKLKGDEDGPEVTREEAIAFVDLLSAPTSPEADPRITPFLPWHKWVLVDPLAMLKPPEAQILRALSRDPSRFGRAGTAMGKRDEEWIRRWSTVPGVDVAKRVKVKRADGSTAGDLDIVVLDRTIGRGIVMEVKSPLPEVRPLDLASTDSLLRRAAEQASSLEAKLSEGEAKALFPASWPLYEAVEWTWMIGHPGEFDPGGEEYGFKLPVVSPLVFDSLGPYDGLVDALGKIVSRPIVEGHDYVVAQRHLRVGNTHVDYDVVRVYHGGAKGSGLVPASRFD